LEAQNEPNFSSMRAYAYEFRKKVIENAEKLIKEIEEEEEK
jgi:hypothetical protein